MRMRISPIEVGSFLFGTGWAPLEPGHESAHNPAMTKLEKPIKRELNLKDGAHVVTIDPSGLRLTKKGRRKGIEIAWKDLVSGDAAMTAALNASVGKL